MDERQMTLWPSSEPTDCGSQQSSPPSMLQSKPCSQTTRTTSDDATGTTPTTPATGHGKHAGASYVEQLSFAASSMAGRCAPPPSTRRTSWSTPTAHLEQLRPKTRADCVNGPRPCPWLSCEHNLTLHLSKGGLPRISGERRALPSSAGLEEVEAWWERAIARMFELEQTCDLDVGDEGRRLGNRSLARLLGVTQQRASQEIKAYEPKFRAALVEAGVE